MGRFVIGPHMRLQEWVAEEKGYFKDEGLDYEFIGSTGHSDFSVKSAVELPKEQISGAYQSIEKGRACDISSACHWTINMAAAAGHGRLWAGAYSILPAAIMATPDSGIRAAQDLGKERRDRTMHLRAKGCAGGRGADASPSRRGSADGVRGRSRDVDRTGPYGRLS